MNCQNNFLKPEEILKEFSRLENLEKGQPYGCLWIEGKRGEDQSALLKQIKAQNGKTLLGWGQEGKDEPLSSLDLSPDIDWLCPPGQEESLKPGFTWSALHRHLLDESIGAIVIHHLEFCDELTLKWLEYLLSLENPPGSLVVVAAFAFPAPARFTQWWSRMEKRGRGQKYLVSPSSDFQESDLLSLDSLSQKILLLLKNYGARVSEKFLTNIFSTEKLPLDLLEEKGLLVRAKSQIFLTDQGRKIDSSPMWEEVVSLLKALKNRSPFGLEDTKTKAVQEACRWSCFDTTRKYARELLDGLSPQNESYFSVLWPYIEALERNRDYWYILDELLKLEDWEGATERGLIFYKIARTYLNQGKLGLVEQPLELALVSSRGDQQLKLALTLERSILAFEQGKGESAQAILEELGDGLSFEAVFPLKWQALLFCIYQSQYSLALEKLSSLYCQAPEEPLAYRSILHLAWARIELERGNYKIALEKLEGAEGPCREKGDLPNWIGALLLKASLYKTQTLYDQALPSAQQAYSLALCLEDPRYLWNSQAILGEIEYERGQKKEGTTHLLRALFLANLARDAGALCEMLMILGKVHLDRKDVGRAEVLLRKARELSKEKNLPYLSARVDFLSAQLARLIGDEEIETALIERSLRTFHNLGNKKEFCEVLLDKLNQQKKKGILSESGFLFKLKGAVESLGIAHLRKLYSHLAE